jgi:hypothetical protein
MANFKKGDVVIVRNSSPWYNIAKTRQQVNSNLGIVIANTNNDTISIHIKFIHSDLHEYSLFIDIVDLTLATKAARILYGEI